MNTVVKSRAPSSRIATKTNAVIENTDSQQSFPDNLSVELFLRQEFEKAMKVFWVEYDLIFLIFL